MESVLDRAPWHMINRPLVLKKWHPNLTLLKEDLQKIPLWVKFFGVPLEYWFPSGLSYVASAIGIPLHTDGLTAAKSRITFARICVEIDASADFVEEFYMQCDNGDWITVFTELEWAPSRCSSCKVFGHSTSSCSKQSTQAVVQPSLDNTEEEWTEVRKRRKGKEVMANPLVSDNSGHSLESERTSAGSGSLVVPSPIAPTAPLDNPGSNGHSGSAPPSSPPGSRPGTPPSEGSLPPSHLSIGQDLTEPSTASPDQNPLGRLAVGSV